MGEAIVVTSGKGGVGKTTTTANLGVALAAMNKRVALIDTDIGLRNLDIVLGLENRIVFDLVNVARQECDVRTALIKDKRYPNLQLLAASQSRDKEDVKPYDVQLVIQELVKDFDYVLVDCPAGVDRGFRNATAGVTSALVITTPEIPSVRDADRAIAMLEDLHIKPRIIVNKIRPGMVKSGDMLELNGIMDILMAELIGLIPDDDAIIASTNKMAPSVARVPGSNAAVAYRNIARRVTGEQVPFMEIKPLPLFERLRRAVSG
jgi:septum site-determining protein MinD